jgi:cold shock protein
MIRLEGTVKWFSAEKGFGFITRDDGTDVFVHHTAIQARGYRTLDEGERVEFEIIEEPKGLRANNVVRLNAPIVSEPDLRARQAGDASAGSPPPEGRREPVQPAIEPPYRSDEPWLTSSTDRQGRRARRDQHTDHRHRDDSERGRGRNSGGRGRSAEW